MSYRFDAKQRLLKQRLRYFNTGEGAARATSRLEIDALTSNIMIRQ